MASHSPDSSHNSNCGVYRVPEECPAAVELLIQSCLDYEPGVRPTAREAVEILTGLQSEPAPVNAGYSTPPPSGNFAM